MVDSRRPLWPIWLALTLTACGTPAPSGIAPGGAGGEFGSELDASQNLLAVSARGSGDSRGTVYVFHKQQELWQPLAALQPKRSAKERFGERIAVSEQGVIVGHCFETAQGVEDAGTAYLYDILQSGASLPAPHKLIAEEPTEYSGFGDGVGMLGDFAIVGSPAEGDSGAAFIFRREGSVWKRQKKLVSGHPDDGPEIDRMFGHSFAVDAQTLVVGSVLYGVPGATTGGAWAFARNAQGDLQTPPTRLGPGPRGGENLGVDVAVARDLIAVGDNGLTVNGQKGVGQVLVYQRGQDGKFPTAPTAVLTAADPGERAGFGNAVAIWGRTIIVGSNGRNQRAGGVYFFEPVAGSTPGWTQKVVLSGSAPRAELGTSLAISGSQLIVGEMGAHSGAGEVRVYALESPLPAAGPRLLQTLVQPHQALPRP